MTSDLSTQFSWILFGRVAAAGLQAVSLIVLARVLGPQQFGILTATLGVTVVLQAFSDLGIAKMLVREHSKKTSPGLVNGGLWLNSWSSAILGLVLIVAFCIIGIFFDTTFFIMLPLAISVAAEKNADTWLGVALAEGDTRINFINLVSRRSATLVLFVTLLAFHVNPLISYTVSVAISAIGSVVFAHKIVSQRTGGHRAPWGDVVKTSRPFWINTFAVQFRNLDSMLVGTIASAGAAGYYSTAARLTSPLRMLPTSLATVMLPHVARLRGKSIKPVLKLIFLVGSGIGAIYLVLAFVIPWVVPLLLGDAYVPAIVPLQIVLIGLVFASFSSLFGAVLQGRGMEQGVALISVATTLFVLTILVILTFIMGVTGAALALASGYVFESVGLFCLIVYGEKRKKTDVI